MKRSNLMNQFHKITPDQITQNTFHLIGSDWMLVTAKNNDKVNTMTASWGGLGVMWGKQVAFVAIRPQRYTKEFVDAADTFSLTFFDPEHKKKLSYLGSTSGRDEDKIKRAGLTVITQENTPYFDEGKLVLLCKKLFAQPYDPACFLDETLPTKWYPDNDYHTLYIAEITDVLTK